MKQDITWPVSYNSSNNMLTERELKRQLLNPYDCVVIESKKNTEFRQSREKIEDDFIRDFAVPEKSSFRQDLEPPAYIRNGSIYSICRNKFLMFLRRTRTC